MNDAVIIRRGLATDERPIAARLYWEAFERKLEVSLGPRSRALAFLELALRPDHALVALDGEGGVVGIAGFKTKDGTFVGGDFKDLRTIYGPLGALWRLFPLALFERATTPDRLVMDGICVDRHARGRGVGTALLEAMVEEARKRGLRAVQLEVVDTNPRARALYERRGFKPAGTAQMGPLGPVLGFRSATTMIRLVVSE